MSEFYLPNCSYHIKAGDCVKLNKFSLVQWQVNYGWYTWGGNRPVCGWYLIDIKSKVIKPLQLTDLDDIYIIES